MARPYKALGLLKKVYNDSTNPKKDELVNELIEKLKEVKPSTT